MITFLPLLSANSYWMMPLGFPFYRLFNIRWFPSLKIKKFGDSLTWKKWPHFHFMFCARYEIHIQAFLCFINGKLSFSDPHLHKIVFKICTHKSNKHLTDMVLRTYTFRRFSIAWVPDWQQLYLSRMIPSFSCIFWNILVIVKRSTGPDFDKKIEVPEIIPKVLEYNRGP